MTDPLEERVWPSTAGSRIAYELGKADRSHPSTLLLAEAFCSPDALDVDDLEPDDWLLGVFASDGEICLRIEEVPETAYIGYEDGTPVASVHNDVFLRRMTLEPSSEDLDELVDRFTPELTLRDNTPFAADEAGGRDD